MNIKQLQAAIRNFVNKYSAIVGVTAVLISAGAIAWIVTHQRGLPPPAPVTSAYYYDLTKGTLFVAPIAAIPPVAAPDAKPGAREMGALAHVFSCGKCAAQSERFIGYIELYADDAHDALTDYYNSRLKLGMPPAEAVEYTMSVKAKEPAIQAAHRIAIPNKDDPGKSIFIPIDSTEGRKLVDDVQQQCGAGKAIVRCDPPATP